MQRDINTEPAEPFPMRADVRAMGFQSLDQKFIPQQVLALYKVSICESTRIPILKLVFFHTKGMLSVLGIGLPCAEVSVDQDFRLTIQEMLESSWKRFWGDDRQAESYKPIIFEQFGKTGGIELKRARNGPENREKLYFKASWMACMEQLFGAEIPSEIEDHNHERVSPSEHPDNAQKAAKQMSVNHVSSSSKCRSDNLAARTGDYDRKISEQGLSTSSCSQVNNSLPNDGREKLEIKIILNHLRSELFVLNADGTKTECKTVAEQKSRREERRTDLEEGSAAIGKQSQCDLGECMENDKHLDVGSREAVKKGTRTLETGSAHHERSITAVIGEAESCQAGGSKLLGIIKPIITLGLVCDFRGTSKVLEANVRVNYQVNQSSNGMMFFHDNLYLSFGCKDDFATIEMPSRKIEVEYCDSQSQSRNEISHSFTRRPQVGTQGSVGFQDPNAGANFDKDWKNTEVQQKKNREAAAVRGAYMKGTDFWVGNKHFLEYMRYEATLKHYVPPATAPRGFRLLNKSNEEEFRQSGICPVVNLDASAMWTPEGKGEHTWVFAARQTLQKCAYAHDQSADGELRKRFSKGWKFLRSRTCLFNVKQHKTSRSVNADFPASSYLQEYSRALLISHDFSHVERESTMKEPVLQLESSEEPPGNQRTQLLGWRLKNPCLGKFSWKSY